VCVCMYSIMRMIIIIMPIISTCFNNINSGHQHQQHSSVRSTVTCNPFSLGYPLERWRLVTRLSVLPLLRSTNMGLRGRAGHWRSCAFNGMFGKQGGLYSMHCALFALCSVRSVLCALSPLSALFILLSKVSGAAQAQAFI
jgi:hypothetical protein